MRTLAPTLLLLTVALSAPSTAFADEEAATINLEKDAPSRALTEDAPAILEAPPPPPYRKSLVVDSSIGALFFLGKFGKTAPPGPLLRVQAGYEFLRWLMLFGEGELAFTDTSRSQEAPKTRAFPIFGFGGGVRFTARFGERFGVYLQGNLGAMKADIRTNALGVIGFKDAESLSPYAGGRLGLEWYQVDRHLALGASSGIRLATGFKGQGDSSTPLLLDASASVRYAF